MERSPGACWTRVRTGRGRIFRNAEITADVLLASACLPTMFRALRMTRESHCSRPLASVADAAFTRNCSPVSGVLA
jgi:hypothetical protein